MVSALCRMRIALIVADAIRALETSARFEDRIEATALFGDLATIAGDAIESIMKASFDPRSIVISKAMQSTRPPWDFPHPSPSQMFVPFRGKVGALRERPLVHGRTFASVWRNTAAIVWRPNRGRGLGSFPTLPRRG